mmetsp:Transcript_55250/g.118808  ORF Transcript_55250/g.118808 Transcript_55250/m.118808 type:complete len:353 (+) Transcript_55250:454-1512(+)
MNFLEGLGVLVGIVADHALQVIDTLAQGGMMRVPCFLLLRKEVLDRAMLPVDAAVQLIQLCMGSRQLLGVLVRRVADSRLHIAESLLQGDVVRMGRSDAIQVLGMLDMGCLERLDSLGVLICRVAKTSLQIVHALPEGGMMRVCLPLLSSDLVKTVFHRGLLRLGLARGLGVGGLGDLEILGMLVVLVCGVAEQGLQVLQALLDGGVVPLPGSFLLGHEISQLAMTCVMVASKLRMCHLQRLYLGRMFVGGVSEERLHIVDALPQAGMVSLSFFQGLELFGVLAKSRLMLTMGRFQSFQGCSVLVGRVADRLLKVGEAFCCRSMVHGERRLLVCEIAVGLAQLAYQSAMLLA